MFKKIFYIFISLIILMIVIGGILYQDDSNKLIAQTVIRSIAISKDLYSLKKSDTCIENSETCFKNLLISNNGIYISSDLAIFSVAAFTFCNNNTDSMCVKKCFDILYSHIQLDKLWVSQYINLNTSENKHIYNLEIKYIDKFLRKSRQSLFNDYNSEKNQNNKSDILNIIKTIDSKLIDLKYI